MKKLSAAVLALAAGIYASAATAQEAPQIDLDEIQKRLDEMTNKECQKIDTDGNGEISLKEYQDYIVKQTLAGSEQSFAQLDKNNDKKISPEEYAGFMSGFTTKLQGMLKNMQEKNAAEAK